MENGKMNGSVVGEITEEFPVIAGVPTPVLKCGQLSSETPALALIIPGNPGVPDYYRDYMLHLHQASSGSLPVWCIGHAGHGKLPSHVPKPKPVGKPYTLQGQISNKVTCIKDTISASTKLFLIGHSIGCYMILHMLKQLDSNRVLKCFQLFPTVERMALSPKGQTTTPMLRYFRWAAWPIVALPYFFIPDFVKRRILEWFFQDPTICPSAITGTMRLINPTSVCQSFNLAHEEMNTVLEADYELIREFASKLFWYYGAKDHWCPVEYYQDMKNRFPQMDIVLCKEGFEHAFVLKASKPMADLTWQWAENLLS